MAPPSRMSNGNVTSTTGSALVVQYAGGSQSVTVPPNTRVTVIKATTKPFVVGDQVVVVAHKTTEGSLAAHKVLLVGK
jgi:hypothetical protein